MNKYLYTLFVSVVVILGITAIFFPWNQLTYQTHKNDLLHQNVYETESPEFFDIAIQVIPQETHFTIIVTIDNATIELNHLKVLAVDAREVSASTENYYPSIGLIDDFDLALVDTDFTAFRQQGVVLIYETDEAHPTVYVWVAYTLEDGEFNQHYFVLQG